jgi:hypothetical protein
MGPILPVIKMRDLHTGLISRKSSRRVEELGIEQALLMIQRTKRRRETEWLLRLLMEKIIQLCPLSKSKDLLKTY